MDAFVVQGPPELAGDASWCAGAADGARCAGLVESRQATARSNTRRLGSAARLVCLPMNLSFPWSHRLVVKAPRMQSSELQIRCPDLPRESKTGIAGVVRLLVAVARRSLRTTCGAAATPQAALGLRRP